MAVIEQHYREVVAALDKELGTAYTFAYFWATRRPDAEYPLLEEVVGEIVNGPFSASGAGDDPISAYDWVSSGMHL
ncbi:hypothetical protein G5V58_18340 [Nocardioides anomalus]|uniref:Uncharacterized protein n=1 Tax=Nocardioides anomalus TaxID=2712223 RepID=A0A6G6WGK9_9ACTN|nr:hypothetical protein [Nocardioides anomalus]QIG44481.1 hypothetical protein G5V58_18340 [Nocardioides anomalus]